MNQKSPRKSLLVAGFFAMVFLAITALFFFSMSEQIKNNRDRTVSELHALSSEISSMSGISETQRTSLTAFLESEAKFIFDRYSTEVLINQLGTLVMVALFFLTLVGTYQPEKRYLEEPIVCQE